MATVAIFDSLYIHCIKEQGVHETDREKNKLVSGRSGMRNTFLTMN